MDIKQHPWFADYIDWEEVYNCKTKSSYTISSKQAEEAINFDSCSEEEMYSSDNCAFEEEFRCF